MSPKQIINIINLGACFFFCGILGVNAEEKGTLQKITEIFSSTVASEKKLETSQKQNNTYSRQRDKLLETLSADVQNEVSNYHKKNEKLKTDLSAEAKMAIEKLEIIQAREKMHHNRNLSKRKKKLEETQATEAKASGK